jgi:hypothetical protein
MGFAISHVQRGLRAVVVAVGRDVVRAELDRRSQRITSTIQNPERQRPRPGDEETAAGEVGGWFAWRHVCFLLIVSRPVL